MSRSRVDLVDETFIRASPDRVRERFAAAAWLVALWPHLTLTVVRDRGVKGVRWEVTGAVVGEMEVWLEPWRDGVIVHHYLRGVRGERAPRDVGVRHARRWKAAVHALKDELEGQLDGGRR
jgi:hypothetical protein